MWWYKKKWDSSRHSSIKPSSSPSRPYWQTDHATTFARLQAHCANCRSDHPHITPWNSSSDTAGTGTWWGTPRGKQSSGHILPDSSQREAPTSRTHWSEPNNSPDCQVYVVPDLGQYNTINLLPCFLLSNLPPPPPLFTPLVPVQLDLSSPFYPFSSNSIKPIIFTPPFHMSS